MNGKQIILFGGLLTVAMITGWLVQDQGILTDQAPPSPRGPDLFVNGMDLKIIGEDGNVHYRVQASRMEHFPYDDHSDLTDPFMQVFSQQQAIWDARSERGRVADQGDTVWLLGRAVINRPQVADQRAINVVTSDLMVKPQADTAETTAAAVITSGAYRIEGVGMLANFRENRLDLHSQVRGRIDAGD
ncbi:MAG: LPS export ABC transporter periplasmic protein LptC [Gammaproteobacteria bacterium]